MSIYEYDEELHKKTLHDEGYEDGFHDGALSNLVSLICRKLQKGKSVKPQRHVLPSTM